MPELPEQERLRTPDPWRRWGPFLAERQWGTVREDYSPDGDAWNYFTHDHARSRCFRWGEDGLLGICDRGCRLCFSLALWNGRDPILKERLFGLTPPQGNHGEDVKESYFYLDATPTHSYLKALYRYPQGEFPYQQLVDENARRRRERRGEREYELADTGAFDQGRYFDVVAEYAKNSPDDLLIRITASNRGSERAALHLLPQIFFRNTWAWGSRDPQAAPVKPRMQLVEPTVVQCDHQTLGRYFFCTDTDENDAMAEVLFTENETNVARLFDAVNYYVYVRDAFGDYVIHHRSHAVNPANVGTKAAPHFGYELAPGASVTLRLRLSSEQERPAHPFGRAFDRVFDARLAEADGFYDAIIPASLTPEQRQLARRAYAGLLWSQQFYHYDVAQWLEGDPAMPPPPNERRHGRNSDWSRDATSGAGAQEIVSVPDKWEYPWRAGWDMAFHCTCLASVDPAFARAQLLLLLRDLHLDGRLPADEWQLSAAPPPVHAWACWRVFRMTAEAEGREDRSFLRDCFEQLQKHFDWWAARRDRRGRTIFEGGFLGVDNVGVFDSNAPSCAGIERADGAAWIAFYAGSMLVLALELAQDDAVYAAAAARFLECFGAAAEAIDTIGGEGLWDEVDGFYYDRLASARAEGSFKLRSMAGLIPLLAVHVLEEEALDRLPNLSRRAEGLRGVRGRGRVLLAVPSKQRLLRALEKVLDEKEFLSPHGARSTSAIHRDGPVICDLAGRRVEAQYVPGESSLPDFGGNANWRGPVWFPLNYLLIEALERYHDFYGDELRVEFPTGSGQRVTLRAVARELSSRLTSLFLVEPTTGRRPYEGVWGVTQQSPPAHDPLLFHEYFDGDTGRGLGASHQTGWTALVVRLLDRVASDLANERAATHPMRGQATAR